MAARIRIDGAHHRIGGGLAHALRAALGIEAVIAAHQAMMKPNTAALIRPEVMSSQLQIRLVFLR